MDDRLLRAIRPEHRLGRQAGVVASTVTWRGSSWFLGTALLVALGGPRRRAALEGAAAWLAVSATVRPLKSVAARRRPTSAEALGPAIHSPSMPSSHAASATAYAVAAGLRHPPLAPVLGVGAVVVGWSRVATARHFPGDVLAGAAYGSVVGLAVHALSRRAVRGSPATGGSGGTGDPTSTPPGPP